MSARYWARLRTALQEQYLFARDTLRSCLPDDRANHSLEQRIASLLHGREVRSPCVSDFLDQCDRAGDLGVSAAGNPDKSLKEFLDSSMSNWWSVLKNAEKTSDLVTAMFYGLSPDGSDKMHDWAFSEMSSGAGKNGDNESFLVEHARYGFFEADLSLLDVDQSAVTVAVRRALRAGKDQVDTNIRLLAALDGFPGDSGRKKCPVQRVENLKLALEKASQATERARTRANQRLARMQQKALKHIEKAQQEHKKEAEKSAKLAAKMEKTARRDAEIRRKEDKLQEQQKQLLKQASFMQNFIKSAKDEALALSSSSITSLKEVTQVSTAAKIIAANTQAPVVIYGEDGSHASVAEEHHSRHHSRHHVAKLSNSRQWRILSQDDLQRACSGDAVVTCAEAMSVMRWATCLIPFHSDSKIVEEMQSLGTGQPLLASLRRLLYRARARRVSAFQQLPGLLKEHRRMRKDNRHDLFPRFAMFRADVRGRAGAAFDYAPYKLLQFHHEIRPPFTGTMRRKSQQVKPRRPFAMDADVDYDFDSADEWEDEDEQGENVSDDEKEKELEDAELKSLGFFSDDFESEDDFLDDDGDDAKLDFQSRYLDKTSGIYSLDVEGDGDDEDDDGYQNDDEVNGSPVELESECSSEGNAYSRKRLGHKRTFANDNANSSYTSVVGAKRVADYNYGPELLPEANAYKQTTKGNEKQCSSKKRRRTYRASADRRVPKIQLHGPVLDRDTAHPVLDRFPILRFDTAEHIPAYKPGDEGPAGLVKSSNSTDSTGARTPSIQSKRRREILNDDALNDLARILQGSTCGKDAIAEQYFFQRRKCGLEIPTKAEVLRAIDRLACRVKGKPWRLRDPLLSKGFECAESVVFDGMLSGL